MKTGQDKTQSIYDDATPLIVRKHFKRTLTEFRLTEKPAGESEPQPASPAQGGNGSKTVEASLDQAVWGWTSRTHVYNMRGQEQERERSRDRSTSYHATRRSRTSSARPSPREGDLREQLDAIRKQNTQGFRQAQDFLEIEKAKNSR